MELELKEIFRIVVRKWWIMLLMGAICCTPVVLYEQFMSQPIYEANTKLVVTSTSRAANQSFDSNEISSNLMIINTYKEIITSPAIMDIVKQEYPEIQRSADQLVQDIKVSASDKSQVMNISIRDLSHRQSVIIVNAVAEIFKREIPTIMIVDNVTVLSAAKLLDKPLPLPSNLPLKLVIAAFVSFVLSIGIIFLREYLDDTIKSEEDVRVHLNQPTLGMVSRAKGPEWNKSESALKGKVGVESIQHS